MDNKILMDCPPEKVFWLANGQVLRNIYELISAIETMDDWAFKYHVNKDNNKNDFADWIMDALGDDKLARKLEGVMKKKKYLSIIKKRVKKLTSV